MLKKTWVIIIVVVIIASSVAAYWYTQEKEEKGKATMKVEAGDLVEVNYTGRFVNGTVFDTNIESVANDENISKSYSFKPKSTYSTLKFTVGSGQRIKGFDEGVLNMTVAETRIINVTAEDGYGIPHNDLFINISRNQSVPLFETLTKEEYDAHYSENIAIGMAMTHYFWKWNVSILDINHYDDGAVRNITMWNKPDVNSTINVFGWNSTIIEIDSSYHGGEGRILIQHSPAGNITVNRE
ncbi:MAG: FKBP-type peptidyl-prolyl cis-trans isomerase, partial [Thermoplasmatales archaeon]|nr:FKBP-type peptidyl-prolyl cis-trans isomerase [Thermoplasmatales archaeon]